MNKLVIAGKTMLGEIGKYKLVLVIAFVLLLNLTPFVVSADSTVTTPPKKTEKVLAAASTPTPIKSPTPTVLPTVAARRLLSPTVTQTPSPTPTSSPSTNTSSSTNFPTSAPASNSTAATVSPTSVPTSAPTPTATPTSTPTPTPVGMQVAITVDYTGQKTNDSYSTTVEQGQNAWEAIKKAIGVEHLTYTDYGGDLGIFITGFNGVNAASNQYYEFRVNGVSSNVGVSSYICKDSDTLTFVLTTF